MKRLNMRPLDPARRMQSGFGQPRSRELRKITWQPAEPRSRHLVAIKARAAVGTSWAVQAKVGISGSAQGASESDAALLAGPAVLTAFQLAHPSVVNVVGGEVPARVELIEGSVDGIGQLGPGHVLSRPPRRWQTCTSLGEQRVRPDQRLGMTRHRRILPVGQAGLMQIGGRAGRALDCGGMSIAPPTTAIVAAGIRKVKEAAGGAYREVVADSADEVDVRALCCCRENLTARVIDSPVTPCS
ncbi:hypothetical protein [Micromonospora sp. CA-111912]|uniref:hypothetical protein n=1 Tax=Micromonospora sp. CA-111912 TaxID=3239955 RepID=UPI003D8C723F